MEQAHDTILRAAPHAILHTFHADFSDLADVDRMAQDLRARFQHLDVLVNNAGRIHDPSLTHP